MVCRRGPFAGSTGDEARPTNSMPINSMPIGVTREGERQKMIPTSLVNLPIAGTHGLIVNGATVGISPVPLHVKTLGSLAVTVAEASLDADDQATF